MHDTRVDFACITQETTQIIDGRIPKLGSISVNNISGYGLSVALSPCTHTHTYHAYTAYPCTFTT